MKTIEERERDFVNDVSIFLNNYDRQMLINFVNYWTEKNKSGTEMRFESEKFFELSKRIATWNRNSNKFCENKPLKIDRLTHNLSQAEQTKLDLLKIDETNRRD